MASVSVARPTHSPAPPMSRRVPLGSLQHALNSPYNNRTATANANGKRQRSADLVRELAFAQPAPKKQAVDPIPQTPVRPKQPVKEKKAPLRKAVRIKTIAEPQEAARTREDGESRAAAGGMNPQMEMEVRMWQKHYRKAFPTYVFYFESIPDDVAVRMYKQVKTLGSKIERFFSSSVTHVVTTRPIPDVKSQQQTKSGAAQGSLQTRTINPLMLQKASDMNELLNHSKSKKHGEALKTAERQPAGRTNDILVKAKEYGMKVWALEKLQRMMDAMFEAPVRDRGDYRGVSIQAQGTAAISDLSKLLLKERLHGPVDRDPTAVTRDMVYFKGPFLLVRDLTETHRPIMVREYAKVQNKDDGEWPQFRSVGSGKCPFIEDRGHGRREEPVAIRPAEKAKATATTTMEPPKKTSKDAGPTAQLRQISTNVAGRKLQPPFQLKRAATPANEMAFTTNTQLQENRAAQILARQAHEPFASGLNPSTAANHSNNSQIDRLGGTKAPMSKGMYDLKRKVAGNMVNERQGKAIPHSARVLNLAAIVEGADVAGRNSVTQDKKKIAIERMAELKEARGTTVAATAKTVPTAEPCDPKPGYCENCREKFEDFDTHIVSKRHRKFAAAENHWAELDQLLDQLERKPKGLEQSGSW